tara:strand:+ start:603 stop:947 length:345 start_codon:yes stop_codon:yes gene_type:complete
MSIIKKIENTPVICISKKQCINCKKLKALFDEMHIEHSVIVVEEYMEMYDDDDFIFDEIEELKSRWAITSYPMTFIKGNFLGHYNEIMRLVTFNQFESILKQKNIDFKSVENDF